MRIELINLIFFMGIVTYITRVSFLLYFKNRKIPTKLFLSLKYIPISIFSALIFPNIFIFDGKFNIVNPYFFASTITIICMVISRNYIISISFGIASLSVIRNFF